MRVWAWLRRSLIAGFFVTVPLMVSIAALLWVVQITDYAMQGLDEKIIGTRLPGLGIAVTVLVLLAVGALATNVLGRRLLQRGDSLLLHVPLFRAIYAPVKQLISAFSPDNEAGFKRMVLIDHDARGMILGFLTKEFEVDRGQGPERMVAVYVPTNHLYLGDVIVCQASRASYPDLTVQEGIRVFLTGGMAIPERMAATIAARQKPGRAG
jgi:uncharacterized membrane protein